MDLKGFCSFVDIHKTTAWKTYPAHAARDTDFSISGFEAVGADCA